MSLIPGEVKIWLPQTSAHSDLGPLNLAVRCELCQREGWHSEILDTEVL